MRLLSFVFWILSSASQVQQGDRLQTDTPSSELEFLVIGTREIKSKSVSCVKTWSIMIWWSQYLCAGADLRFRSIGIQVQMGGGCFLLFTPMVFGTLLQKTGHIYWGHKSLCCFESPEFRIYPRFGKCQMVDQFWGRCRSSAVESQPPNSNLNPM